MALRSAALLQLSSLALADIVAGNSLVCAHCALIASLIALPASALSLLVLRSVCSSLFDRRS
jgi:hypothetical protein